MSIIKQYFFYASGVLTCMWLFLLAFVYLLHTAVLLYIHSENKSAMLCNFVIAIFHSIKVFLVEVSLQSLKESPIHEMVTERGISL